MRLTIPNEGHEPTLVRNNKTSYIDNAMATEIVKKLTTSWQVLDDEYASDYHFGNRGENRLKL